MMPRDHLHHRQDLSCQPIQLENQKQLTTSPLESMTGAHAPFTPYFLFDPPVSPLSVTRFING